MSKNKTNRGALERLKNCGFLRKIHYANLSFLSVHNPVLGSKLLYIESRGKRLNLSQPVLFNEKIMWLKLNTYFNNVLVTKCADKYGLRDYVASKGLDEYLPKLYYVWDNIEDVKWNEIPESCVLKCTHGCGYNIIIPLKREVDEKSITEQLKIWMKEDYYKIYVETVYKNIKKRIICEELLGDGKEAPVDYKLYCFNGEVKAVLLCEDRTDEDVKLTWMTKEWEYLDVGRIKTETFLEKPDNFEEMIELSKNLSEGFPFVRVDLYNINGRIFVGEMTFTPYAGVANYYSDEGERLLGNWLVLNN